MKSKQVTIRAPSPTPSCRGTISGPSTPSPDAPANRALSVPAHMVAHGQDGYRTPTVEDYEMEAARPQPIPNGSTTAVYREPASSKRNSHSNLSNGVNGRHHLNMSNPSLSQLIDRLHWRERIRHYTWTFFTITMATGGIANVLYTVPFRFPGLYAIGVIFFLLNIVLFVFNILMISLRFYTFPETFMASLLHPTERLFVPAAVVSFGTILLNISQYGPTHAGHWLNDAVAICFWIDAALALISSMGVYLAMWSTASFTIAQMTPVWIFPAYPLLIIGPHAAVLSQAVEQSKAFRIIVGGFTLQGIGFMVSMMIYSAFIYRLMTQKLPQESNRPGMFVSVGPSGFTVAGVIGMAEGAQRALPASFMGDRVLTAQILRVVGSWMSLWIWGLAIWFFFISLGSHWSCIGPHRFHFTMTWYSYVFPNTALITSTFAIGKTFNSKAIQIVGCVLTPILIGVWFFVVGMMIRAVALKQILWPQKGEDKDEGGFKGPKINRHFSV